MLLLWKFKNLLYTVRIDWLLNYSYPLPLDMSMHFLQLKQMKTLLSSGHDGISLDKPRVLSLLLHTCDVSHPAKTWNLHHQWTSRCMEEFFKQGDIERERGLEFSPLCDRHNTMVPQSQIGKIKITDPIFTLIYDGLIKSGHICLVSFCTDHFQNWIDKKGKYKSLL